MQDPILKKAISNIKAGDKKTGYKLLTQVIKANPRSKDAATAWLWMSVLFSNNPTRKRKSIESALAINLNRKAARKAMATLLSGHSDVSDEYLLMRCPQCNLKFQEESYLKEHFSRDHQKYKFTFDTIVWTYDPLEEISVDLPVSSQHEAESTSIDVLMQRVREKAIQLPEIEAPVSQSVKQSPKLTTRIKKSWIKDSYTYEPQPEFSVSEGIVSPPLIGGYLGGFFGVVELILIIFMFCLNGALTTDIGVIFEVLLGIFFTIVLIIIASPIWIVIGVILAIVFALGGLVLGIIAGVICTIVSLILNFSSGARVVRSIICIFLCVMVFVLGVEYTINPYLKAAETEVFYAVSWIAYVNYVLAGLIGLACSYIFMETSKWPQSQSANYSSSQDGADGLLEPWKLIGRGAKWSLNRHESFWDAQTSEVQSHTQKYFDYTDPGYVRESQQLLNKLDIGHPNYHREHERLERKWRKIQGVD